MLTGEKFIAENQINNITIAKEKSNRKKTILVSLS
tara:strand:- start:276 stop:380 length:105 start_codon:yes stop_codon:yes gene_type:complete